MDSVSVTPAAVAPRMDAPASRSGPSEGDNTVKPFEKALEQQVASADAQRREDHQVNEAPEGNASAAPGAAGEKTTTAELLQGGSGALAGDAQTSPALDAASGQAPSAAEIAAMTAAPDIVPLPAPALLPAPAQSAKAADMELTESPVEPRTAPGIDVPARTSRARDLNLLDEAKARAEPTETPSSSPDAPLVALPSDGAVGRDAPVAMTQSALTLDSITASVISPRWAAAQPGAVDTAASAPVTTARIETPFGESGWSDAFQQKIVWLVDRQQQSAELSMNPPHLGPVEVVLNVKDDGTRIAFSSPHAAVREAIEGSLAELRTALADKGLALGGALVSADSGSAREQLAQEARSAARGSFSGSTDAAAPVVQPARIVHRGLIDLFA